MNFSLDRDLLIFEPRLFAELAWPAQVLARGTDGQFAGTSFTSPSADFIAAAVAGGMILVLPSADASLEIVSAVSPGELTVSVLRAEISAPAAAPSIAPTAPLAWHIVSFAPQAAAIALEMLGGFGLSPADPSSPWTADDIAQPQALRTLSAYGVLATVLAGAANRADADDGYWAKASHYRRLFEQAMQKVRLGLDNTGNGAADVIRHPGAARLRRD